MGMRMKICLKSLYEPLRRRRRPNIFRRRRLILEKKIQKAQHIELNLSAISSSSLSFMK